MYNDFYAQSIETEHKIPETAPVILEYLWSCNLELSYLVRTMKGNVHHLTFLPVDAEEAHGCSMTVNDDMEDLVDRIRAMKQIESSYSISDVLPTTGEVTDILRKEMCGWCYQVVDSHRLSRTTVYVALNCLDRFISSPQGANYLTSKSLYKLAVTSVLRVAIKVNELRDIKFVRALAELSKAGDFGSTEINATEQVICMAIGWNLSPPSPQAYVKHFISMMPCRTVSPAARQKLLNIATYQNEMAVMHYGKCVNNAPSAIAMASLLNALSLVPEVSHSASSIFLRSLGKSTGCSRFLPGVNDLKKALRDQANLAFVYSSRSSSGVTDDCLTINTCPCNGTNESSKAIQDQEILSPFAVVDQ